MSGKSDSSLSNVSLRVLWEWYFLINHLHHYHTKYNKVPPLTHCLILTFVSWLVEMGCGSFLRLHQCQKLTGPKNPP